LAAGPGCGGPPPGDSSGSNRARRR
jgi:hypothetical protein